MRFSLPFLFIFFVSARSWTLITKLGAIVRQINSKGLISSTKKLLVTTPFIFSSVLPYSAKTKRTTDYELNTVCNQERIEQAITEPVSSMSMVGTPFVRNAVQSVGKSVVRIDCERPVSQMMSLFTDMKEGDLMKVSGSGVIASKDGFILTNAHVVEQAKKLTVTLANGRSFKAKAIAFDEFTDLAVIKVDLSKENGLKLEEAPFGDSSSLQAGDWVIAVGCPVGLDFTVTLGVVSSPRRSALEVGAPFLKGDYIQTDAALNSGNSGGPLVNDAGEVIGINTMVRTNSEAIGFAIPINRAAQIYQVLKAGNKPTHAYFGMEIMSVTPDSARIHNDDPNTQRIPERHGALVMKVIPESPADKAGLRRNDVIIEVNGADVRGCDDADLNLDACKPGRPSKIKIVRGEGNTVIDLDASPQDLFTIVEEKRKQQQSVMVIKPK